MSTWPDAGGYMTSRRARALRVEIDAEDLADAGTFAAATITGCTRGGCAGTFSRCYLPARICGRQESPTQ